MSWSEITYSDNNYNKMLSIFTDLSGKYAYHIRGMAVGNGSLKRYIHETYFEWFLSKLEVYDYQLDEPGVLDNWLSKFTEGTLTDEEIYELESEFHDFNCNSYFNYSKISLEDNLAECIMESERLLREYLEENERYYSDGDDVPEIYSDGDIANEILCHFYIKFGKYYVYGINLDSPMNIFSDVAKEVNNVEDE